MLNALALPLLFASVAGVWIYRYRRVQRPQLLLTLCLLFAVSAYGYAQQPDPALFSLLLGYMSVVFGLLLHAWGAVTLPIRRTPSA